MIHLYCGDGKGKTTCAVGLALRGAGAGMNVVIVQFLKGSVTSELNSLDKIPNVQVFRNSKDYGFVNNMSSQQLNVIRDEHNNNLSKALNLVENNKCDMLVFDELTYVYDMNLVDKLEIDNLLKNKQNDIEIVITGRNPNKFLLDSADYVTEMKMIKHPFENGVPARKGVEF